MKEIEAWAVVRTDEHGIPAHWSENAGQWLLCVTRTRNEARAMHKNQPMIGERVVRVKIEWEEE